MLRAETAASSLKTAGEVVSDSLLLAMILKGLPLAYKTFCTVTTQKDKDHTFAEFKVALRSFEETKKQNCSRDRDDTVMMNDAKSIQCYTCYKWGISHFNVRCEKRRIQQINIFGRSG